MNLEKRLSDNDPSPTEKDIHNIDDILKENVKLNEVVEMQIKYQEM